MSREPFIQSEDKEFEVTFREVRNWEEYANLDFEADHAPLTEEEAGTVSEPETEPAENVEAWSENEWNVSNVESSVADEDVEETSTGEDPKVEPVPVPEAEDVEAAEEEQDAEEAPEADAEDTEFPTEAEVEAAVEKGTSTEASVVSPVEDNFEVEPAWEEDETSENAEETSDAELQLGEPAADTEAVGSSLETALVHTEDADLAVDDANDVTAFNIDFDNQEETVKIVDPADLDNSDFLAGEVVDLNSEDSVELNPYAFTPDASTAEPEVDTFEAVSTEAESLNKAETVEEIPAEYNADTLPATQPIETGDFLSFDLSDDEEPESNEEAQEEAKPEVVEGKTETDDDDDENYSLELDLSEDEDN